MGKLLAEASTKEELEKLINEYYYSTSFCITDDMRVLHQKDGKFLDDVKIVMKRNRWRFERK